MLRYKCCVDESGELELMCQTGVVYKFSSETMLLKVAGKLRGKAVFATWVHIGDGSRTGIKLCEV